MPRRICALILYGLLFSPVLTIALSSQPVAAQGRKPSQVLRQLAEQQQKLAEDFDRDASEGKAQLYEWETRAEPLRKLATERAAGFKVADWKGDELLALASIYQQAEMFGAVAATYRAWLTGAPKSRDATRVRFGLVRALLENDQIEEAQKLLEELFRQMPEEPSQFISLVTLQKDLALAWRDRGKYEMVLTQAKRGYDLAQNYDKLRRLGEQIQAMVERDRITLAAIVIASQEKLGFPKEAKELNQRVLKSDFENQPGLKEFFEAELASARVLGNTAPELAVARWLNGQPEAGPKKLADLRGKVVLLGFWAMWSSPCVAAFPHFREFQTRYGSKGFEIIGVTRFFGRSDTEEDLSREQEWKSLQNFKNKHRLTYPVAVGKLDDVTNDERYSVTGLPVVILIDRRGQVRHIKRGVGEYRKLARQIERLIGES